MESTVLYTAIYMPTNQIMTFLENSHSEISYITVVVFRCLIYREISVTVPIMAIFGGSRKKRFRCSMKPLRLFHIMTVL